jgi:hypothetical protein
MMGELIQNDGNSVNPPCDPEAFVLVKFANGDWSDVCLQAKDWSWDKYEGELTITHYRIVSDE